MSGNNQVCNSYYVSFLEDFNSKEIDFGNMSTDKAKYSSDFSKVYNDLNTAMTSYVKSKRIGKQAKKSK